MIGATYTGVHAIGWNEMVSTWAGRALVVLVLVTIGLGVLYGLYGVGRRALARWRRRHELSAAPTSTIRYINALKDRSQPLRPRDETHRGFKTFTVYLGKIDDPPSETQRHILSHWDVVVVNSFKQGVVRAVHKHGDSGYFLARLDVQGCLEFSTNPADDRLVHSVGIISNVLVSCLKVPDMQQTPFHGVVLTNWEQRFGPAVLSHLLDYINHLGLMVWLEISTSGPVDVRQYEYLTMSRIEGIIYRNGTLSPDGTHRDYFQMSQVRSTMRALAAQKPAGSCHFAMMEVVDDDVVIPHHVLRRTFKWCNYNSAMSWIAPRSALMDAEVAASRRLVEEPLSALAWLKNDALARIHDRWRLNDAVLQQDLGHDALFEKLNSFLPDLSGRVKPSQRTSEVVLKETEASIDGSDLLFPRPFAHLNPFSISPSGVDYTGLGCFQLGLQCSPTEVKELLEAHVGLRDLDLLERVQQDELDKIALELRALLKVEATKTTPSTIYSTIRELINLLSPRGPKANDELRVWVGLHSGFRTRNEAQVWGMYGVDSTRGTTDIYLSNKVTDRTGTILHTFLSSHGFTRFECLLAETMLAESNNRCCPKWGLAPRLVQDIEQLTPAETLRWMRHLDQATCYESSGLVAKMLAVCEYQLLDAPSLSQLRRMSSVGYLNGRVAAEELVQRRLQWYEARGCSLEYTSALAVFKEINVRVEEALTQRDTSTISQLTAVMETVLQPSCIEARADFLAMSVLCAARKIALGEILLEVLDRNPRPNLHHVQAACFAEFYAVGARCDAYFDMTPNELGRILFDRIRSYLKKHPPPPPPPPRPEQGPELPTTYASMDVDLDPSPADYEHTSVYYRITSLGIFAIPALIDIILLTTVGRGLYLSAFMDDADKTVATAALMVSLLLGGAFGTWITSGGSYYMCSMAFPATSMFVMTRFVAGLAVVLTIGTATCIGIGIAQSFRSGVIFLIYLVILTTYLMVVSAMSIYEMQGQGFQSGRLVIVTCVPLLLVSPLLTTWLHHDIVIYPSVLAIFLVVLLIAARRIISKWNSWYLGISCVTDEEVIDWYQRTYMSRNPDGTWKGELPPYSTIRQTLWDCVKQGQAFRLWQRSPPDEFVERLAKGHPAVILLLTWYCKYMGTRLPLPYSTTWNLQLKSAIESLVSMQKGLKQHSSFLHWVHSGQEVWGGLLYFALALMDKWTALFTGESIVGLSISSETYRLAVGFGLAYYLAGAIILDAVSKPLWALAHTDAAEQVSSLDSLRHAISNTKRQRRALYWSHLFRYSLLHVWGLAVTTALLWAFESSRSATQMYLAYVGAYSGLLWYQYSRIYARHRSDRALALGTMVGFTTCILLRLVPEGLSYSGVIGLAAGTWTAALLSFLKATVGWAPDMINGNAEDLELATYTRTALDTEPEIPQSSLARTFGMIMALPLNLRRRVDPSQHPRIKQILLSASRGQQWRASRPFLGAEEALRRTAELWESGRIAVEIVCARSVVRSEDEGSFRSLSKKSSGLLHIIVITPSGPSLEAHEDISHVIAEALVSSTAENIFGWSHHHAILAEPLVHNHDDTNGPLPIPEGVQRQLQFSRRNRETVISRSQESVLHHLLLGVDVEQEWDLLPHDVRTFLLQRARGQPHQLTNSVAKLMSSRFKLSQSSDAAVWLARSDLSASLAVAVGDYAQGIAPDSGESEKPDAALFQSLVRFYHKIKTCIKFAVLSLVADPEYQRELHYMIRGQSSIISWGVQRCLTAIWLFCKALQDLILPLTLETATIDHAKQRMDLVTLDGRVTCFMHSEPDGSFQLHIYSGRHHQEPSGNESLVVVNTYTSNKVLRGRDEYDSNGVLTNSFAYEYAQSPSADASREVPIQRLCLAGKLKSQVVCYDRRGYIVSGSTLNGTKPTRFRYWYTKDTTKSARQILRAEYAFPAITIEVVWGVPRGSGSGQLNELSPFPRVTAALFLENDKLYNAVWTYDERFQATLRVTLNGAEIPIPPMISDDWFEVLQRPRVNTFHSDNPLSPFPSRIGALSRLLKHNVKRYPVRISRGRSHLWQSWKSSNEVDAVTAKWLDERILRSSYILKPYWKQRDRGELEVATEYLNANAKAILPELDLTHQVSSWVPLGMRFGDLRNLASSDTQILSGHADDTTSENLHVLAMDTGTWPNEPGGVSACRRDLVDNLSRIRWHILAESANDFGIPRFQVERNVDSLTILPQWGLDFLHPTHGIFQRSLYSAIAQRTCTTTDADIQANFIPIVRTLVRCARMDRLGTVHVKEATQALVDLNDYFETRSWNNVWMSDVVKQTWRELWLSDVVEGAIPASQWLEAERPTISQLDNALDMWHRYLFIFSIPVPENIPTVFQASHHFTGATFGVLCKIKRKCTLQVWDHCISFREITAFLSSAVSLDSIFVNNALISLGHLSCVLVLHHADMVLPCAEYFNPGWEIELGTCEGTLQHRRLFNRKINAVVNGIANMEKYKPAKDAKKTGPPTVIMLSHVRYVKDIKTAILAADVLVNHWGFRDYRLNVFGDMQRSPGYSSECQQMIDAKDLRGHVFLKGLGDPLMALEDAWLFMNSSISEGLPLAMGEAALAGLPVVCTDVGSSFSVVTDPTTGQRFSEVVAPNDPTALARAQINILALLGPWASFAEDEEGYIPPSLSLRPSRQDVERISQRMYDKAEQRRKLGLLGRANTYKNFSSERYLREHEQMLRLGDYRSTS
ncbi:hypothetical protein BJY00DRAFT_324634 [Aspergillus carlsbadensis]|nr:hypothetical protein BJY00DRAFT_324634 [Aspergillus carlsbadensis]